MTNVEKYVRSHETGELVRVDQAQAEAIQVTEARAATLDGLLKLSQLLNDDDQLKPTGDVTDDGLIPYGTILYHEKYQPIVDAILTAANTRRAAAATERDKSTPLTTRQGQLSYLITDDCASEMEILETLYSDISRDEYLRDLQTVRDYWDRITDKL
jgi:hypothetical protein